MLSLERCRALLGTGCELSNADLERLRDHLRILVEVVLNDATRHRSSSQFRIATSFLPDRDEVEERAAIIHFDAHVSRDTAERMAVASYLSRVSR
jgi:hypothetical protein